MTSPTLYALSVRQPWADQILRGDKREEYRKTRTWMRGWFLLHASRYREGRTEDGLPRGCIIGIARVVDCQPGRRNNWAWRLETPLRLKSAIPLKGQVGFFTVPASLLRRLPARMRARLRRDPLRRQRPS